MPPPPAPLVGVEWGTSLEAGSRGLGEATAEGGHPRVWGFFCDVPVVACSYYGERGVGSNIVLCNTGCLSGRGGGSHFGMGLRRDRMSFRLHTVCVFVYTVR